LKANTPTNDITAVA